MFHAFVPLRSNFGAELYQSALPENQGYPTMATLPHATAAPEFQRYVRLGELAYTQQQGERARALIAAHPAMFAANIFKRVYFFWASVPHPADHGVLNEMAREMSYAIRVAGRVCLGSRWMMQRRREIDAAWLFFWAIATIPLMYYGVTVQARFRHPLEPLLCILAVYLFRSATPPKRVEAV